MGNIKGSSRADVLYGTTRADNITAGDGDDRIFAAAGDDTIFAALGADYVEAGDGADKVYGGGGDDLVHGGAGNDTLLGEANNDTLYGDDGNDLILGGFGADDLWGGAGADTFRYENVGHSISLFTTGTDRGIDVIHDFQHGIDKIDLVNIDANQTTSSVNEAFTVVAQADGVTPGQLTITTGVDAFGNPITIILGYSDTNPGADLEIHLSGVTSGGEPIVTPSDFLL